MARTRRGGAAPRDRERSPGGSGRDLWSAACNFFEAEGFPTQRKPGAAAMEGFPTALGNGVGLEVHEDPGLGRSGAELRPGDVISIERSCAGRISAASRSRTSCS